VKKDTAVAEFKDNTSKLADLGKGILKRVFELSPITESEAMQWAKSQLIDKTAKSTISKTYNMASFLNDLADFYRLCGGRLSYVNIVDVSWRAHASGDNTYNLGGKADRSVLFHELTHILERSPSLRAAANSFLERRTEGESLESLKALSPNSNYGRTEVTLKDNFYNPYMGKIYPNGATEIFTMLTQELADPARAAKLAAKDPESFKFAMGMMTTHSEKEREFSELDRKENEHVASYKESLLSKWQELKAGGIAIRVAGSKSATVYPITSGPNKDSEVMVIEYKKARKGSKKDRGVASSVRLGRRGDIYGLSSPNDAVIIAMQYINGVPDLTQETDIHAYNGGNYLSIQNIPTEALGE